MADPGDKVVEQAGPAPDLSVEFDLSEEQRALRATARSFCEQAWPQARVRTLMAAPEPYDRATWQRLGTELGMLGLAVPEELGGSGTGHVEVCLLAEELGRGLAPAPVLGTLALGTAVLRRSGDEQAAKDLLPRVVEGELLLAVAAGDAGGRWLPETSDVRAQCTDGCWQLTGAVGRVVDAPQADVLVVLAATDDGAGLFLVESGAAGLDVEPLRPLDQTRPQATVRLAGTPARALGAPGDGRRVLREASDLATVVLAAEAVGGMQRVLDLTVDYAKTRLQFGRVIGSFQGVKHRCADMLVSVEHARSAAYHAAWALDQGTDDAALAASLAHVVCAQAYVEVVDAAIQVHGGIGFTWEHPLHLYAKRAVSGAALLGGRAFHVDRLATLVLDDGPPPTNPETT